MKKYLIILVLAGFTLSSCYEKLRLTPDNAITNEQMTELLKTANETVWAGVVGSFPTVIVTSNKGDGSLEFRYNRITGSNIVHGLSGNDIIFASQTLVSGAATAFGREEYNVEFRTAGGLGPSNYWTLGYELVTLANKALDVVTDEAVTNNAMKKYQAWPLFVRAYAYNYLVENFADAYSVKGGSALGVPIYTTFAPDPSNYKARATLTDCYKQINDDLDKAIANFIADGTDGYQASKNALDVGAAYFLKARVALCTEQWATVISNCDKILSKYSTLMTETQYVAQRYEDGGQAIYFAKNSGFLNLAENPETVYGFDNAAAGAERQMNTQWMNIYGCTNLAGSKEGRMSCIDQRLYDKIADKDYRKKNFLAPTNPDVVASYTYPDGNTQTILPYATLKYAATAGVTANVGDLNDASTNSLQAEYAMFRLSEVLLMKTEAELRGGTGDWKKTLDILVEARTNEELTVDTYPAHTGLSNLEIIQLQTRIEMWGENGLEFYNNKRWNIPVDRTGSANHWGVNNFSVANMTLQLPTQQLNLNGKLVQNP